VLQAGAVVAVGAVLPSKDMTAVVGEQTGLKPSKYRGELGFANGEDQNRRLQTCKLIQVRT
jgi:hypothetical protein